MIRLTRLIHARAVIAALILAAVLLLPSMASVGMFFDGMIYASVSRNLAEGLGTWWSPHFSEGLYPVFHEHPPLMFWIQSLWFRLLGDSYLTERAHDLTVVVLTATVMALLWRRLSGLLRMPALAAWWWLPLLLWILVPKWAWSYRNNMLENTLTLWCLGAVWLSLSALSADVARKRAMAGVGAGLLCVLAILTKGLVGLFVLAAPLLLGPALSFGPRAVLTSLAWMIVTALAGMALVLAIPEARSMLQAYWANQVSARAGLSMVSFGMLLELAQKIAPMVIVLAAVWWWMHDRDRALDRRILRLSAALVAIGFSASAPLVLADQASAHYLVPALPYFALGFALPAAWMIERAAGERGVRLRLWLQSRPGVPFRSASVLLSGVLLIVCAGRIGEVRKNEEYHRFFDQVVEIVGSSRTIAVDNRLVSDWTLHAVAQRHHGISLITGLDQPRFLLAPADGLPDELFDESDVTGDAFEITIAAPRWVLWCKAD